MFFDPSRWCWPSLTNTNAPNGVEIDLWGYIAFNARLSSEITMHPAQEGSVSRLATCRKRSCHENSMQSRECVSKVFVSRILWVHRKATRGGAAYPGRARITHLATHWSWLSGEKVQRCESSITLETHPCSPCAQSPAKK
eukprot:PhF_6_TR36386/c0_g1_i4/m.53486